MADLTCPTCDARVPTDAAAFPFCSRRCRLLDLEKWVSGQYVVSRPMDARDVEELEATLEGRAPSREVEGDGHDE
ncbi:MAG: DNA gyrase inhibitor YacG [Planctomycetes bacterium]|nr:DNA gyrase inhibitor YacG [Planctomycetota bacterium]